MGAKATINDMFSKRLTREIGVFRCKEIGF